MRYERVVSLCADRERERAREISHKITSDKSEAYEMGMAKKHHKSLIAHATAKKNEQK